MIYYWILCVFTGGVICIISNRLKFTWLDNFVLTGFSYLLLVFLWMFIDKYL